MSEPRIDSNLRIGRFLLDDILRSLGGYQWFLRNITWHGQMAEPLLGEIMSCLMHVGAAELEIFGDIAVCYMQKHLEHPQLSRSRIHNSLARSEVDDLIHDVCERAIALNSDASSKFCYHKIFLFGSCLTDKVNPVDVDLGVEIHERYGGEIPEPSHYPFRRNELFDIAAARLIRRGAKKMLSIHDRRELLLIEAPHQLIWTKDLGRVRGPLLVPVQSPRQVASEEFTRERNRKEQELIDAFVNRVRGMTKWPSPPILKLGHVRDITRDQWAELQKDDLVLCVTTIKAGRRRQLELSSWEGGFLG